MNTEMESLKENDVWDLVEPPVGQKVVGCKWVYKIKTGADGSVQRYKARLVAQGFTQRYGTDFDEKLILSCSKTRIFASPDGFVCAA